MANETRQVVESVLGSQMTAQIWTSTYPPVFPFTPQDFSVGAILPMMLYLFRWGNRRGKGKFAEAYGAGAPPTISTTVARLVEDPSIEGFDSATGRAILGDFLLTSILENRRHSESHDEQVQRCFANHYFASWIDLPSSSANLRGVPEMVTALLSNQRDGEIVEPFAERGRYRVGARVQDNDLLASLAPGTETTGLLKSDLRSDELDEAVPLPLDQLVTIRLAQGCGEAPAKAVGRNNPGPIPNQRPIAARAAEIFRDDLLVFLDCYARGAAMPRAALLQMFESAIAIGLTTILTGTVEIMNRWGTTGVLPEVAAAPKFPLFVDCSSGSDLALRATSEESGFLMRQALNRLPAVLMHARLLDHFVRSESEIDRKSWPPTSPDGTDWLNLLGSVLNGSHEEARDARRHFTRTARKLRDAAESAEDLELRALLGEESGEGDPGRALAEALSTAFTGSSSKGTERLNTFLSSALMIDEVNGLAKRRKVTLHQTRKKGQGRRGDALSFVLTNPVIEYLVHRHVRRTGKGRKEQPLSYPDFLRVLREQYGLYIDRAPPNLAVPSDLLQRNRRMLERRLRDLGLLVGVNDAERMKKLKARYRAHHDIEQMEEPA
ncbi:hypothetical protein [Mesorhizobium sp.]|uniref:hypothetical protein n=1 Tax=Mesorhizobium sp. TaxID=1871066 RepID=UPI00257F3D43|nr:hypothetical protein [Mesorhizobium sp.]